MNKYYIAYGSNLNLTQMAQRCPTAKVVGTGVINDYQLVFWRVATIEPKEKSFVPVVIWEIDSDCEKSLDMYEGYPYLYHKELMDVQLNNQTVKGLIYIMNRGKLHIPSQSYFQTIYKGYEDVGFEKKTLWDALKYTNDQIMEEQ